MLVPGLFVAALFMVLLWRSPQQEASPVELFLAGPTMGTRYTVKVVAPGPVSEESRTALETGIGRVLELVDSAMSTWREDSELVRFNRHGTESFKASPAFLEVLSAALAVSVRSGGAFDVTVGPLVDAWGFGPEAISSPPSEERIEQLLEATGTERLRIDAGGETVEKASADLRVDLSALAKGYAVDRVAAILREAGYSRFMVEVGGEVVTRGFNPDNAPWQIGIEVPDPERRAVYTVVTLDGAALATSGDYRNFRLEGGRRISHIIDPRTGRPVGHSLASVSVVASTCMMADAWATALSVLGPEEGLQLAREENLAALFIFRRQDGTLGEVSTANFEAYRATEPTRRDLP
jgi:thiamine biosynthesis lipoprotein